MSQAKLTLRPPPNVEFVQGYPGIPPGAPDRPQAAVKGAIEVRLGPQGVKAKYVRIELRKVETLPGGGQQNTFVDYVGQSPINLWQSSEEFSTLHAQDIPFYIRIPESIAPSLALEKGAGVKYELVGQVCVQGKTSFLRRSKPIVLSTSAPIIIDKHELHSTWPVYQQPESRHLTQDAVVLTVDRSQNCYGPGDRVSVTATVRSDSLHTVILRGFEFTLKETTIFRAGPHSTSKKGAPQVKINIIGEQKVPVNQTLYGGTAHKTELACTIPPSHTTTTLTSARHIDITYILGVKALMGTGKPLIMELPVIVSNWPRYVSAEAVRRIGNAPSLCLHPVLSISSSHPHGRSNISPYTPAGPASAVQSHTIAERISSRIDTSDFSAASPFAHRHPQTMPNMNGAVTTSIGRVDEFGFVRPSSSGGPARPTTTSTTQRPSTAGSDARPGADSDFGVVTGAGAGAIATPTVGRRSRAGTLQTNRFTIVNAAENEIPEEEESTGTAQSQSQSQSQSQPPSAAAKPWLSAEEEKASLYQRAVANVERVQGGIDRMPSVQSVGMASSTPVTPPAQRSVSAKATYWPTAEEEKVRLFNQAQSKASITQGFASPEASPPASQQSHARTDSKDSGRNAQRNQYTGAQPSLSAGAALYSAAMSSVNRHLPAQQAASWSTPKQSPPPTRSQGQTHAPLAPAAGPARYLSAEEEKDILRRYHDARNAVARHQEVNFGLVDGTMESSSSQIPAHDPNLSRSLSTSSAQAPVGDDQPPPWVPSSDFPQNSMSEKERYRQAFEAREAAAVAAAAAYSGSSPPPPPRHASPPPAPPGQPLSAAAEKELLRQQYSSQDAAAAAAPVPSSPPPAFYSPPQAYELPAHLRSRPAPALPAPPNGGSAPNRPLTAAEEKAMLRARYEAEERGNGASSADPNPSSQPPPPVVFSLPPPSPEPAPTPPPLMPRPPSDYIQETQDEDARLMALGADLGGGLDLDILGSDDTFGLRLRPASPFTLGVGFDSLNGVSSMNGRAVADPPPLPPKVPLTDY